MGPGKYGGICQLAAAMVKPHIQCRRLQRLTAVDGSWKVRRHLPIGYRVGEIPPSVPEITALDSRWCVFRSMVSLANCDEMPPSVSEITALDSHWRNGSNCQLIATTVKYHLRCWGLQHLTAVGVLSNVCYASVNCDEMPPLLDRSAQLRWSNFRSMAA